jgi:Anti-sigma-K factor rskA/Putative zinc-finger
MSSNAIDIHALAGAYALDALNDIERAAFVRHMAGCPACELEVAELQETAYRLAEPVAATPPPGLRAAVLAEIARTPQVRSARSHREPGSGAAAAARWRRWTAAAVAAGIIAAGGGTATWIVAEQRLDATRQQLAAVTDVLKAPDAQVHTKSLERGGVLTVVVSATKNAGVVLVDDLPPPPDGKTYELWLMVDSVASPLQVLPSGQTKATKRIEQVGAVNTIGLSIERAGSTAANPDPDGIVGTLKFR